ncbi:hypothetical protein CC78DRAFT_548877 [Lojkania enalia]|uniref:Uncharacterized protein n=1 Tax=Lojkania enalia TaxID=147567 RepID=A0A9P4JXF6_9PLEO|nr:hypothetical protein CC78DRAFT_548877 [Didymosphaeria enalia]
MFPTRQEEGPSAHKYPYFLARKYLCGHPHECIQVDRSSTKRMIHIILPEKPRGLVAIYEQMMPRCRRCATQHARQRYDEVIRNQGLIGEKGLGCESGHFSAFSQAKRTYRGVECPLLDGYKAHEEVGEDEREEEFVGGPNRARYQRAMRMSLRTYAFLRGYCHGEGDEAALGLERRAEGSLREPARGGAFIVSENWIRRQNTR